MIYSNLGKPLKKLTNATTIPEPGARPSNSEQPPQQFPSPASHSPSLSPPTAISQSDHQSSQTIADNDSPTIDDMLGPPIGTCATTCQQPKAPEKRRGNIRVGSD